MDQVCLQGANTKVDEQTRKFMRVEARVGQADSNFSQINTFI